MERREQKREIFMPIGFRRYGEGVREGKIKVLKEEERKKERKEEKRG